MDDTNPYEAPTRKDSTADGSEEQVEQGQMLSNTRFCIGLTTTIAIVTTIFFSVQFAGILWFYFRIGVVPFEPGKPVLQFMQSMWSLLCVAMYAILSWLLWRYGRRIGELLRGPYRSFDRALNAQNSLWFAIATWALINIASFVAFKIAANYYLMAIP